MPILIAPTAARVVAKERGLALPVVPEPPAKPKSMSAAQLARLEQAQRARERLWPLLHDVFPEAFCLPAVPLAIGIHRQVLEVAGDSIGAEELSAFMRYWVSRWSYRMAVWRGEARRNLDGSLAGVPTIEHRNSAARNLWGECALPVVDQGEATVSIAAAAD